MTAIPLARANTFSARGNAWAWAGIAAFLMGLIVTWSVQFVVSEDEGIAGGTVLLEALDTASTEALYRVTSGVGYLTVAALLFFAVGLSRSLQRRMGESVLPMVVLASFIVTAASLALAMSFRAQVFDGFNAYAADPTSHVTMNRLQQDTVLTAWVALLAAVVAVAIAGFRGQVFGRAMAWFSVIVAVLMAALCLGGVAFPANIPALIWLAVISTWSLRQAN